MNVDKIYNKKYQSTFENIRQQLLKILSKYDFTALLSEYVIITKDIQDTVMSSLVIKLMQ